MNGESLKPSELLKVATELPAEALPGFIGELETAKATAWARLTSPVQSQPAHDELLGVAEAARRLSVSEDFLYRHSGDYAFTRRVGRRKVRFSAQGVEKYIREKRS